MAHDPSTAAVCKCGQTRFTLGGAPIESVTCYCTSCRTAAQGFERELGAPPTVTPAGGVDYCLFRKDRVTVAEGGEHLREYRLKPDSPTRRLVTACCSSPMVLDFDGGHWLTVYRDRLPEPAPPVQLGIMTRGRPEGAPLPDGVPAYATAAPGLVFKLLSAWAAMGFRRPKFSW